VPGIQIELPRPLDVASVNFCNLRSSEEQLCCVKSVLPLSGLCPSGVLPCCGDDILKDGMQGMHREYPCMQLAVSRTMSYDRMIQNSCVDCLNNIAKFSSDVHMA
jgi:hypothetical protein